MRKKGTHNGQTVAIHQSAHPQDSSLKLPNDFNVGLYWQACMDFIFVLIGQTQPLLCIGLKPNLPLPEALKCKFNHTTV
jgi:hypothetical protein